MVKYEDFEGYKKYLGMLQVFERSDGSILNSAESISGRAS